MFPNNNLPCGIPQHPGINDGFPGNGLPNAIPTAALPFPQNIPGHIPG